MSDTSHILKMRHALLVDDDEALLAALKLHLESNDFIVSTASNGLDALKTIMSLDVDVVICDFMMPKMAGDMFYLAVERVKPHVCKRFIFVTGCEGDARFSEFLAKTKSVVLYKPITPGKLMGTIKILFERNASDSSKR